VDERMRIAVAEAFGTGFLVIGGCGTAIIAGSGVGTLGISIAFGLSLLVMVYTIGPITGCHINPAVTLGLLAIGKTKKEDVPYYIVGQIVGCIVGAAIIYIMAKGVDGFSAKNNFAANGYDTHSPGGYNLAAVIVAEIVMTAFLTVTIAAIFHWKFSAGFAGVSIGLVLTLIHLISIPIDNTSVNPARSFATVIFGQSWGWEQLWVFIVFPIIGGVIGALIWRFITTPDEG
jgi:aquaporin Z